MSEILAFALGILARLGVPILLTILMVALLLRLDCRWQAQFSLPERHDLVPCWQVKVCSETERQNCKAAACPQIPCWQVFRAPDGQLRETCLTCPVFRLTPTPVGN